jgi:hypothetical protein
LSELGGLGGAPLTASEKVERALDPSPIGWYSMDYQLVLCWRVNGPHSPT